MALSSQPYKGARDFYPPDKRFQKYLFQTLRQVVESFGYEEYDAPLLESLDIYLAKTGQEIVNEQTYTFQDRGGRDVVIRPEMTPSVSRMVAAKRQELAYPLRLYSIPNLWRYERPQIGRYREHWQLNVDLFGQPDISAEIEMMQITTAIFQKFGAGQELYSIHLNSRKLMDYLFLDYLNLSKMVTLKVNKLIDRINKMTETDFQESLKELLKEYSIPQELAEKIINILKIKEITKLPEKLKQQSSYKTLNDLLDILGQQGINNIVFDITIMRGFDYYTDIVFEVMDNHPQNNRSLMGGGRYDNLVGLFGVDPIATVGFGLGDATLTNFIKLHQLEPSLKPEADLYFIAVGNIHKLKSYSLINRLREADINVATDFTDKKIGDKLKTAVKKSINYVLIVGKQEIDSQLYTLRNLQSSKETKHSVDDIIKVFQEIKGLR